MGDIVAYDTYGITVLSYIMQFYPPSQIALPKERDVVQMLTVAPRVSIPTDVLRDFKDLMFTTQVRCFELVCEAARYRAALFFVCLPSMA